MSLTNELSTLQISSIIGARLEKIDFFRNILFQLFYGVFFFCYK